MNEAELEQVRTAMFTDPGVKAVDDLRLVPAKERGRAIAATITVAAPSVDLDLVHAVIARVLADEVERGLDRARRSGLEPSEERALLAELKASGG